jgi:hypothetical protein
MRKRTTVLCILVYLLQGPVLVTVETATCLAMRVVQGSCRTIYLQGLPGAVDRGTGWQHLAIPLININWENSSWQQQVTDFSGCSSSIGAWDVDRLEFKANSGNSQSLCIANIQATTA